MAQAPSPLRGLKYPGGGRPFYGQRWPHPAGGHARKQRRITIAVARHRKMQALASGHVAVDRSSSEVRAPISSTKTSDSGSTTGSLRLLSRGLFGTRRALWLLVPLFPRRANPGYGAADRRAAHQEPREGVYVVAPLLLKGGVVGSFLEVLFKQFDGLLSSSFGADPGLFFGARGSPRLALST